MVLRNDSWCLQAIPLLTRACWGHQRPPLAPQAPTCTSTCADLCASIAWQLSS